MRMIEEWGAGFVDAGNWYFVYVGLSSVSFGTSTQHLVYLRRIRIRTRTHRARQLQGGQAARSHRINGTSHQNAVISRNYLHLPIESEQLAVTVMKAVELVLYSIIDQVGAMVVVKVML